MTGYTGSAFGKRMNFNQFAMTCARAFGALIEMRDDRLDAPIPQELTPSEHHKGEAQSSRLELAALCKMNESERLAHGEKLKMAAVDSINKSIQDTSEVDYLRSLLPGINAWVPPSADHVEMKKFMLQQVCDSIKWSEHDWTDQLASAKSKTPLDYFNDDKKSAAKNIVYHDEEWAKELDRTAKRNLWIKQLRESLA